MSISRAEQPLFQDDRQLLVVDGQGRSRFVPGIKPGLVGSFEDLPFKVLQPLLLSNSPCDQEVRKVILSEHSVRVRSLSRRLGRAMGIVGQEFTVLTYAAWLHDVGKAFDPELFSKYRILSESEMILARNHVERSQEALKSLSLPIEVVRAIRHHHERYDGTGYPDGLSGENIPIAARIIAVADSFDAMTSEDRPYRAQKTDIQAIAEIIDKVGTHFCPEVANVFVRLFLREPDATLSQTQHRAC